MTMQDISLDIETLDNKITSAVIAIGAVQFNRMTGEIGSTFYAEVDIDDAMKYGTVSASTLNFWLAQGEEARRIFDPYHQSAKKSLCHAMYLYSQWFKGLKLDNAYFWGNGPSFDIGVLEHAASKFGNPEPLPWQTGKLFRNIRCIRTIVDDAKLDLTTVPQDANAVHHHALHDAKWQARAISMASRKIAVAMRVLDTSLEQEPDLERCKFCGAMVEAPCDEPPPDTCEKALNATYR